MNIISFVSMSIDNYGHCKYVQVLWDQCPGDADAECDDR